MERSEEPRRKPAVAGTFYPGHPAQLETAVERFLVRTLEAVVPSAIIVPHAGYVYSGSTAGKTFASVTLPDRLFILCPNHTGLGEPLSCWSRGSWLTPLGSVPVDERLADRLMDAVPTVRIDELAHIREHAIEVQLPFLQVMLGSFSIVPLCVGTQDFDELEGLGRGLAEVISASPDPAAIVVSSDMNHYEDAGTNREKDEKALDAIKRLAPRDLHGAVRRYGVSMCGSAPAVAALTAARLLGADRSEVVDYTHSGMVTGDDSSVVSYAGVRIYGEAA